MEMQAPMPSRLFGLLLAALMVQGCAEGGVAGVLRSAGSGSPDEFMVLPTKPLELPTDMAALPPPTPGALNRVDFNPRQEAVASLTGRENAAAGTANGAALIARAGPAAPGIRAQLATEDAQFREDNRGKLIPRLMFTDQDELIYGGVTLDAGAAYEALRARGVSVPPAPPIALSD